MAAPISIFTAAKRLGEASGWTLPHLQMEKMIYIAHMLYMGKSETHEELVDARFEAWHYGPICPELYDYLKRHGPYWVPEESLADYPSIPHDHLGTQFLDGAAASLADINLYSITHRPGSAWMKRYEGNTPNIPLRKEDILAEYSNLAAESRADNSDSEDKTPSVESDSHAVAHPSGQTGGSVSWVQRRYNCTLRNMLGNLFDQLHLDIKAIEEAQEDWQPEYQSKVKVDNPNSTFFKIAQPQKECMWGTEISIVNDNICVSEENGKKILVHIKWDSESAECCLVIDGQKKEFWQVSQMILERFFFER